MISALLIGVSAVGTSRLVCAWFLLWLRLDLLGVGLWSLLANRPAKAALGAGLLVSGVHLAGGLTLRLLPLPAQPEGAMCEDFATPLLLVATPVLALAAALAAALTRALLRELGRTLRWMVGPPPVD